MKHRNPLAVFLLTCVTLGIYGLVWQVKTKKEMNALGATIPTAWLIIIPLVNIWWLWKYCEGVDKVTNGEMSAVVAFILLFLLGVIGMVILQLDFNKLTAQSAVAAAGPVPAPAVPEAAPVEATPVAVTTPEPAPVDPSQGPTPPPPAVPPTV